MNIQDNSAPTIEQLNNTILMLTDKIRGLEQQNAELNAKLKWYEEQFRISRQKQFGSSSEKTSPGQLSLFNEAEDTANPDIEEETFKTITYKRRKKSSAQKKEALEDLPVERIEYRLPEHEQICPCCQGKLHKMSIQVRKEIKIIPAQVYVVEHVQYIYACRKCERENISTPIIKAEMPKPLLPGTLASPSILTHIIDQKYTNSMPLYRQEPQLFRLGILLSRQTMANWILAAADPWLKINI